MGASLGRRCPTWDVVWGRCALVDGRPSTVGRGRPTWMGALVGGAGVP